MSFIQFSPGTSIKSADMNSNFNNAVHLSDAQTLTNKVIAAASNTLSGLSKVATATSGSSATSSSTYGDITSASVSITPVVTSNIIVVAWVQGYANPGSSASYFVEITDSGNTIIGGSNEIRIDLQAGNVRKQAVMLGIDTAKAAGTYTYKLRHKSGDNVTSCTAEAVNLMAIALPSA